MKPEYLQQIPIAEKGGHIKELTKGFSSDKKYVIDDQYLLRLFPKKDIQERQIEYDTISLLNEQSAYVPKTFEFGTLDSVDISYMILSYLPGQDGEIALKDITQIEQYDAGFLAGKELKKLHHLNAPEGTPNWYNHKNHKSDSYLKRLKNVPLDEHIKSLLKNYIRLHEHLLIERPNTFQHDDFHPANLLIHERTLSGIIDFQRMDWGDPIHDLTKLGFFSVKVSVPFTIGIVDGYHDDIGGVTDSFWELYTLYSAMHIVSALVWGIPLGIYEKMLRYSLDVIVDHDEFSQIVPKWYKD